MIIDGELVINKICKHRDMTQQFFSSFFLKKKKKKNFHDQNNRTIVLKLITTEYSMNTAVNQTWCSAIHNWLFNLSRRGKFPILFNFKVSVSFYEKWIRYFTLVTGDKILGFVVLDLIIYQASVTWLPVSTRQNVIHDQVLLFLDIQPMYSPVN